MITLTKSSYSFMYGKCVQIAVCEAFDEKMSTVDNFLLETFGKRDEEEGYTDTEIDILVKEMGRRNNIEVRSVTLDEEDNITVEGATSIFPDAILLTTDIHCMYIENHVIYDTLILVKPAFLFENVRTVWSIKKDMTKSNKKPYNEFITVDNNSNVVSSKMNETLITAILINDLLTDSNIRGVRDMMVDKMLSPSNPVNHLLTNYLIP